jgi:AraC-like DNA-binding protein
VGSEALGQTRQRPPGAVPGVDFRLDRVPASADLADLVERHWLVTWDLPAGRRAVGTVLPHPCVNLVYDQDSVSIAGVGRARFDHLYAGRGRVFGVKFRPGAFQPFWGGPVAAITGRMIPLAQLWGPADAAALARELAGAADLVELADVAERHVRAHRPPFDPEVARIGALVHALLRDRSITRVADVSRRFGLSPRSLQRLFQRYVGVTPKWVLRRYRLHEAAARLADDRAPARWTDVAAELGYFDQSHFIRDFTQAVGMTPAAYASARARREAVPVLT